MIPDVSLTMIQDDQVWQFDMQCGDAMAIAYMLFVFLFA
jgi:hypothetical protein